jgi:Beta-lactamase enzyme family
MTTHIKLTQALLAAVRAQNFGATLDATRKINGQAAPLRHFPSIDLAVVRFAPGQSPLWANVLFSREHPQGIAATVGERAGSVQGIRFDADQRDAAGSSVAWRTDSEWSQMTWRLLWGQGKRFVAPYPASLLKLMVAVGVGIAVDAHLLNWLDIEKTLEAMIVVSDNDATTACVALLHQHGLLTTSSVASDSALNRRFASLGLHSLQINNTQANGGWLNGAGAGVGQIHMTAWDTVRLLWLLDAQAPPAPWLVADKHKAAGDLVLLQPDTRERLRAVLQRQQLDEILSSGALRAVPGWVPGLPDAPAFAHKTGTTENYASDAGIVRTGNYHYIVALLSNLGERYAPDERCATTWRVPALGASIHKRLATL